MRVLWFGLKFLVCFAILCAIAVPALRWTFRLPDIAGRPPGSAWPADPATPMGRRVLEEQARHPGKSGVVPLQGGKDALASRMALIGAAARSIDVQYYIWHDDSSGILLLDKLEAAAERGVRVRLLLDDNGIPGLDPILATLNAMENIEIRLFNPSTVRRPKLLGYAFDFFRMNRRMHNKAIIVDGAVAIVGGRNIGDEYFQVGADQFYVDMDVLAMGAIVAETAAAFDAYWNSRSVFGVETVIADTGDSAAFAARVAEVKASDEAVGLRAELQASFDAYLKGGITPEWTTVKLIVDDPAKGEGLARGDQLVISRLGEILGGTRQRLDLVSAYFVPGPEGTRFFADLAQSGVAVNILTNALNTTDVLLVHAGYTKYRRELLAAGVDLFELKLRGLPDSETHIQLNRLGLSGASLHAKVFAVDGERVFIGSFNFDPRSARLNCEMGFLIDSPSLASRVSQGFDGPFEMVSYRPQLTPERKMIWREAVPQGQAVIYQEEPGASWFQQIATVVIGILPVEWML